MTNSDLTKFISFTHLQQKLLLVFFPGSMLGGSIYVLTGAVMNRRTGPAVFLAYILAGCVALLNSLNYSELACRIPKVRRLSLLT